MEVHELLNMHVQGKRKIYTKMAKEQGIVPIILLHVDHCSSFIHEIGRRNVRPDDFAEDGLIDLVKLQR